jgi:hypothetical protein
MFKNSSSKSHIRWGMWGDPLGGVWFVLAHFHVFLFYNMSPLYLCFPFVSRWYTYSRFYIKYDSYLFTIVVGVFNIGLSMLMKWVAWSPQGLNHFISLPFNCLIPNSSFHILGTPMAFSSFVESFVDKVLYEDLWIIFSLSMLADLKTIFGMLSLCYA